MEDLKRFINTLRSRVRIESGVCRVFRWMGVSSGETEAVVESKVNR